MIVNKAFLKAAAFYTRCIIRPAFVTTRAFLRCTDLKKVTWPENLRRIQRRAFDGCARLDIPELPALLEYFGDGVFSGCKNLAQLKMPDGEIRTGRKMYRSWKNAKVIWIRPR